MSLFSTLFGRKNHSRRTASSHRVHPVLDALEDRMAPAGLAVSTMQLVNVVNIKSFAGVGFQENVVANDLEVSVNGLPDLNKSDFQAKITWGDGSSSMGDLVNNGSDSHFAFYIIKGSHIYNQSGNGNAVNVTVTGPGGASTSALTAYADVAAMPSGIPGTAPAVAQATAPANVQVQLNNVVSIQSVAGVGFQENVVANNLAVSVNGQPAMNRSAIHAQINWGDSASWTTADLVYTGHDATYAFYQIEGSHTYNQAKQGFPIVIYVSGPDGTSTSALTARANVALGAVSLGALTPSTWTQNQAGYQGTITVSGGSGGYQSLVVTGLPTGLSAKLSGSTITVSGTPTQSGTFSNIVVSLQDSAGNKGSQTENLTINPKTFGTFLLNATWEQQAMNIAGQMDQIATKLETGTENAVKQFVAGVAEWVGNTLQFLAQKPGVPAQQLFNAITKYFTSNPYANNVQTYNAAAHAIQEMEENPANFWGKMTPNLLILGMTAGAGIGAAGELDEASVLANQVRQTEQVGQDIEEAAQVPTLTAAPSNVMMQQAIQLTAKQTLPAALKADYLEGLLNQIVSTSDGKWKFTMLPGTDGSFGFSGNLGYSVVVNPEGLVYTGGTVGTQSAGTWGAGLLPTIENGEAMFQPNYQAMRLIP